MKVENLEVGDVVYAAMTLTNDGSLPGVDAGAVMAEKGTRGVIVRKGHVDGMPGKSVFLVRFEDPALALGLPVGCWADELAAEPAFE